MSASNFGKKQRMMTRSISSVSVDAIENINNVRSVVRANSQPVINNLADAIQEENAVIRSNRFVSVNNLNPFIRLNRVASVDDQSQSQNNTGRRAIRTDANLEENILIANSQPMVNNSDPVSQNITRRRATRTISTDAIQEGNENNSAVIRSNRSVSDNLNQFIHLNRAVSVDDQSQSQNNTRRRVIRTISADAIHEENENNIANDFDDAVTVQNNTRRDDAILDTVEIESLTPRYEIRQPRIVLNRLTADEMSVYQNVLNEQNEQVNDIDSSGQSSATPSQSELLIFARYEFITGVRLSNRLLFVHDIEQLYFFRYKNAKGNVFICRERNRCNAKVVIDFDGVCKQYGPASHSHPSVGEEYHNIIFKQSVKEKCTNSNILHIERARNVYDSAIVA